MTVTLSPVGGAAGQFFDNNGDPLVGGKLYTYAAGTTTPQATYTTNSGLTPNTNPIVMDSGGRVPIGIWLTEGSLYKFVLYDILDNLIGTWDDITGVLTLTSVTAAVEAAYPVGSIYMNAANATNPATLLGFGTWTALGAGRMLLGDGGGYAAGATGGASTTSLSEANMPSHTHTATVTDPGHTHTAKNQASPSYGQPAGQVQQSDGSTGSSTTGITVENSSTGSGTAATTISPYLVVYMWRRTV